ncbi:unnamed protein product [Caenorhabditis nigoni]
MSAPSAPVDGFTLMDRALASLRLQGTDLRNPSLSISSFLCMGSGVLGMTFPAAEFMKEGDVVDGLSLMRTALEVSRAAWEMSLDEPARIAYQDVNFHKILQLPNRHENISIVVHTFPTPPPALQQLEYSASVARGGIYITIMKGSSLIRVPPPPPALNSPRVVNDSAPHHPPLVAVHPIRVAPVPVPVPVPPIQQESGNPIAAPRPSKTQLRKERKARTLLRIAREKEEREKREQAMLSAPGPSGVQPIVKAEDGSTMP